MKIRVGVHRPRIGLEQHVAERDLSGIILEREKGISIDEEGGIRLRMEGEDALYVFREIGAEGAGGGREGGGEDVVGVGGGDVDVVGEAEGGEGGGDGAHCGEEVGDELGVVAGEDLVADGDAGDSGARDVGLDALLNP